MLNNNGKGLYHIGDRHELPCGCVEIADVVGYTLYVKPGCRFDDRAQAAIRGYNYRAWRDLPDLA
ncbi:MAG: hypothetical protein Q7O66_15525 [Dehalococcoidia bacterium]|nr:hypothetical protein [Dehalococcoidia bacterium]